MRLANELAARAMEHVRRELRPGMKESEAGALWEGFVHGEGTGYQGKVELARGFCARLVGPGHPHLHGDRRPPRAGARADALRDLGLRRRLLVRPHEERLPRRARAGVRAAARAACSRSTRPRSTTSRLVRDLAELDRLVRDGIAEAGYPGQPSHPVAHGVGARAHEPPYAHQAGGGIIQEGMVLAIEPGAYWEGGGGLRLEDNFLVTADGAERLSSFPDDFRAT